MSLKFDNIFSLFSKDMHSNQIILNQTATSKIGSQNNITLALPIILSSVKLSKAVPSFSLTSPDAYPQLHVIHNISLELPPEINAAQMASNINKKNPGNSHLENKYKFHTYPNSNKIYVPVLTKVVSADPSDRHASSISQTSIININLEQANILRELLAFEPQLLKNSSADQIILNTEIIPTDPVTSDNDADQKNRVAPKKIMLVDLRAQLSSQYEQGSSVFYNNNNNNSNNNNQNIINNELNQEQRCSIS